jgi:hypothetical protein
MNAENSISSYFQEVYFIHVDNIYVKKLEHHHIGSDSSSAMVGTQCPNI